MSNNAFVSSTENHERGEDAVVRGDNDIPAQPARAGRSRRQSGSKKTCKRTRLLTPVPQLHYQPVLKPTILNFKLISSRELL